VELATIKQQIEISFATPLRLMFDQPSGEYRAFFTFQFDNFVFRGENMSATMQIGTYATVSVEWKDSKDNPAKVEGPTKWESTVPATVQCTVATGNPLIANLYAPGPLGKAQIQATADADLGSGVKTVTSTIEVEVISGEAVGGEITFTQNTSQGGPPAAKPATAIPKR